MSKKPDNLINTVIDYKNRQVSLYVEERNHILTAHDEAIGDQFHCVYATVEQPDSVYQSSQDPKREVFFSANSGYKYLHYRTVKVIVEYKEASAGKIVTAFPVPGEGGGISGKLYPDE